MDDDIELEIGDVGQEFGVTVSEKPALPPDDLDQDMEEGELSDNDQDLRRTLRRKKKIHERLGPRVNFNSGLGDNYNVSHTLLPVGYYFFENLGIRCQKFFDNFRIWFNNLELLEWLKILNLRQKEKPERKDFSFVIFQNLLIQMYSKCMKA